jgi:hypothetical protein
MADHNCMNCSFRAKYDINPKSFLGRLWRWHIGWYPGWKAYKKFLTDSERNELIERYNPKR